jgi:hypothetical protein
MFLFAINFITNTGLLLRLRKQDQIFAFYFVCANKIKFGLIKTKHCACICASDPMPASKMAAAALVRAPAAGQLAAVSAVSAVSCAQSQLSMLDHRSYTVAEGAPVHQILKEMLGPRCDENRDASHQLELKIQALHDGDFAKSKMKVEMWTFHGDGTTWINATSIFKYMYTGSRDNFARMQKRHFETCHIPHKLLEITEVRNHLLFSTKKFTGTNSVPDFKPSGRKAWNSGTKIHLVLKIV